MGNPHNEKECIEEIVMEMFLEGGLDITEKLCLQDFIKVLGGHLSSDISISLGWKGSNNNIYYTIKMIFIYIYI